MTRPAPEQRDLAPKALQGAFDQIARKGETPFAGDRAASAAHQVADGARRVTHPEVAQKRQRSFMNPGNVGIAEDVQSAANGFQFGHLDPVRLINSGPALLAFTSHEPARWHEGDAGTEELVDKRIVGRIWMKKPWSIAPEPNMHLRKLPLAALRTFEAAARQLSFKHAAEELCVSATTVSNQIRRLERDPGCKLFIRKTRTVVLTDAGRSLSKVLTKSLENIRAEVETQVRSPRKSVSLAVGPIFASRWMIPRLGRFRDELPGIDLELHNSPRITDASLMTCDIAVDWGIGTWPGLDATRLLDIVYSPVLSPDLARQKGLPNAPKDVAEFPIFHEQDRSEWMEWLKVAGCERLSLTDKATIVDTNVVIQAAIDGQGMVLGIFPYCQADVEAGRLLKPFDLDLAPTRSFYLPTRPASRLRRDIGDVFRWMVKEAGSRI